MNAEVLSVLEEFFPGEPTDEELVGYIKEILAIDGDLKSAKDRIQLRDVLKELSWRLGHQHMMSTDTGLIHVSPETMVRLQKAAKIRGLTKDEAAESLIEIAIHHLGLDEEPEP